MPEHLEADKRGYLKEDFRLFHLKDSAAPRVEWHYHEFDKLVLVLGGKVTYLVEGVTYFLQPWDLLVIRRGMVHRPIIEAAEPYERAVVWLGREYLERRSDPGEPLDRCFETAQRQGFHLLRLPPERRGAYLQVVSAMEEALRSREYGAKRLCDALCQQLLVGVNRDMIASHTAADAPESYRMDHKMEEILVYIASHLGEDLSAEALSKRFYISQYYLMRRFKAATGTTLHQYTRQRRLLAAAELIRGGMPVLKASEAVGFRDYTTFLRAFQAMFQASPREFQ